MNLGSMAELQTLHLAHLPPDLAVHVALYIEVHNAPYLRDQLLQGNQDFEYALIDASVILSTTHVLAAVFRAANDYLNNRLKSRNVHSEIVFSLGANNNVYPWLTILVSEARIEKLTISCGQIAQSLRTFGITAKTSNLLAIKLSTDPSITSSTVSQHLSASIRGTLVEFSDMSLANTADIGRIKKMYKLGAIGDDGSKGKRRRKDGREEGSDLLSGLNEKDKGGGVEGERKELEVAILGLMALRGAV